MAFFRTLSYISVFAGLLLLLGIAGGIQHDTMTTATAVKLALLALVLVAPSKYLY